MNGDISLAENRKNNKGEADYAMYFHAMKSAFDNIMIIASDTDVVIYGLPLFDSRDDSPYNMKNIVIERSSNEYICINTAAQKLQTYDLIKDTSVQPIIGHCVLAIYLLAGSDYIAGIFGISSGQMLNSLFHFADHISPVDDLLVKTDDDLKISHTAFNRLLCCVYLERYKRLYSHITSSPVDLYNEFQSAGSNMNTELQSLLEWLGYDVKMLKDHSVKITSLEEWSNFTQRVCYFMNHGSKNLYQQILPSATAINYHCLRGTYVMHIANEHQAISNYFESFDQFGWVQNSSGLISVLWDANIDKERQLLTSKRKPPAARCYCQTGTCMSCKNCAKACKPCHTKCKCKGECSNPHNAGGTCGPSCIRNDIHDNKEDAEVVNEETMDDSGENEDDSSNDDDIVLQDHLPGDMNIYFDEDAGYLFTPSDRVEDTGEDWQSDSEGSDME